MTDCGHGWHNKTDCDTCTLERVAPEASDRIEQMGLVLDEVYDELCGIQDSLPAAAWERIKALIAKVQV